jgi:Ni2+-binding GTPase involved in maturation of urease and hydrogenase
MKKKMTKLIIVGGFLGAGKTTLLMESAKILAAKGHRVGLITNDQAEGLVDSVFLKQSGSTVEEVSGSCFCCNFDGFVGAIRQAVSEGDCDIVIAEPVGSCTDLTATIVRPMLANHPDLVDLAPLTVLADPQRLMESLEGIDNGLHESAAYIYRKQLEDAGTILIGKSDLLDEASIGDLAAKTKSVFQDAVVAVVSSKTGQGLEGWLETAMKSTYQGSKQMEMDYDVYAEGEAVLGWMNTELSLVAEEAVDWDGWFRDLIVRLATEIDLNHLVVGHLKAIIQNDAGSLLANVTGRQDTLQFRGGINPGKNATLTINARVQTEPGTLEKLVFGTFEKSIAWAGTQNVISLNTLSPGRPNPTHRIVK